jgi:nucleotide-binding universal stress UspA family protein
MKLKHIVFPTDFSNYNDAALKYASWLALQSGATLHFVHVADTRELGAAIGELSYLYSTEWEEARRQGELQLKNMTPPDPGVKFKHHSLMGIPDVHIVQFAVDQNADLIVMASHGRRGLSRLVMGSVAEAVMRKAPCPVMIVKQPHESKSAMASEPPVAAEIEH